MVNHCRLNTVLYFPNCPRQPKTASGIRKDAELTLIADTMTIQIINRSYLLDGDQDQQGEHGPRRGRGRALPRGRGRPGPPGSSRGVHGQRVDSGRGIPLSFSQALPRPAPASPSSPCDFTGAGAFLEQSKMDHRRRPPAFLQAPREEMFAQTLSTLCAESIWMGLEPPTDDSPGFPIGGGSSPAPAPLTPTPTPKAGRFFPDLAPSQLHSRDFLSRGPPRRKSQGLGVRGFHS